MGFPSLVSWVDTFLLTHRVLTAVRFSDCIVPLPGICHVAAAEGTDPRSVPEGRGRSTPTSRNRGLPEVSSAVLSV